MNANEHLTDKQIIGYRARAFADSELREIGRHLLRCPSCRKGLPAPTVAGFMSAMMTERSGADQSASPEKSGSTLSPVIFSFADIFSRTPKLVLSGGALVILFGVSLFIWLGLAERANTERDVAKAFDSDIYIDPKEIKKRIISPPVVSPSEIEKPEKENAPQSDSSRDNSAGNRTFPGSDPRKENSGASSRTNLKQNFKTKVLNGNKQIISSTRGGWDEKCSEEASVLMETGTSAETVQLRWRKIPSAVKYHLYVSDDEEILVDEYETERENVYVLKKPLDPLKTYKWKIIITLENGQTIVGDAQKFTVRDLRSDQEPLKRQKKSQTRCLAGN